MAQNTNAVKKEDKAYQGVGAEICRPVCRMGSPEVQAPLFARRTGQLMWDLPRRSPLSTWDLNHRKAFCSDGAEIRFAVGR